MALNYLKQDNVGLWLRHCSWSGSVEDRPNETINARKDELQSLMRIQLSPQIKLKKTVRSEPRYIGMAGYVDIDAQDGAHLQLHLPAAVRGHSVEFSIKNSNASYLLSPTKNTDIVIQQNFLDRGHFRDAENFGAFPERRATLAHENFFFPSVPADNRDIIWETWIPLDKNTHYIELEIWYPDDIFESTPYTPDFFYRLDITNTPVNMSGPDTSQSKTSLSNRKNAHTLIVE